MTPSQAKPYLICDSQVHAPDLPHATQVGGIDIPELLREMDGAGVDRCVIVPLEAPGPDQSANNVEAVTAAQLYPDRFVVMGRFDLTRPENRAQLPGWRDTSGMVGIRIALVREPNRSLFLNGDMDWFWKGVSDADIPVAVLAPGMLVEVGRLIERFPDLRIALDHLALPSHVLFPDLMQQVTPLLELAKFPNVCVKASAVPCSTPDTFPFPSVHQPILRVIEAYGAQRVFWGSDLSRLPCPYEQCVDLFSRELEYAHPQDKEWVLGRAITKWLGGV